MTTKSSFEDGILTLRLEGELDHHAARGTVRELERAIDRYMPQSCVLDLEALTFMDSSGIAVILKAFRRVGEIAAELRVIGVRAQPLKVLAAAGLERIINIEAWAKELYI